jgi:hypothetical protein
MISTRSGLPVWARRIWPSPWGWAAQAGIKTRFATAADLLLSLSAAHAQNQLKTVMHRVINAGAAGSPAAPRPHSAECRGSYRLKHQRQAGMVQLRTAAATE